VRGLLLFSVERGNMLHVATYRTLSLVPPTNVEGTLTYGGHVGLLDWQYGDHITQTWAASCSTRLRTWDSCILT